MSLERLVKNTIEAIADGDIYTETTSVFPEDKEYTVSDEEFLTFLGLELLETADQWEDEEVADIVLEYENEPAEIVDYLFESELVNSSLREELEKAATDCLSEFGVVVLG